MRGRNNGRVGSARPTPADRMGTRGLGKGSRRTHGQDTKTKDEGANTSIKITKYSRPKAIARYKKHCHHEDGNFFILRKNEIKDAKPRRKSSSQAFF